MALATLTSGTMITTLRRAAHSNNIILAGLLMCELALHQAHQAQTVTVQMPNSGKGDRKIEWSRDSGDTP